MPTARYVFASSTVNNIIYAIGGFTGSIDVSANEAYDPSLNTWTTKASMPTPRAFLAAAAVNSTIYALGGSNAGTRTNANEAYQPDIYFIHQKN